MIKHSLDSGNISVQLNVLSLRGRPIAVTHMYLCIRRQLAMYRLGILQAVPHVLGPFGKAYSVGEISAKDCGNVCGRVFR